VPTLINDQKAGTQMAKIKKKSGMGMRNMK
jgi:hypothetical protein